MKAKRQVLSLPSMKLKNVQTNNVFTLVDREQICKCLKQTFNSQIPCEVFEEGQKRSKFLSRATPRFVILNCDKSLEDLIPREEATKAIREKLLGSEVVNKIPDTLAELKEFCYLKGIQHSPSIGYEKLNERVEKWKFHNTNEDKKPKEDKKCPIILE